MSLADFIPFTTTYEIGDISAQSRIKRDLACLKSPGEDERIPEVQGELFTYQKQFPEIVLGTDRVMNIQQPGTGKTCAFVAAAEALKTKSDIYQGVIICAKNEGILGDIARQAVYKCTPPGTYIPKLPKDGKKSRRKNVTTKDIIECLRPWYEFITHDTLLKIVVDDRASRPGENDAAIINSFDRRVLIIDEAHNFVEGTPPRMDKIIRISNLLRDKMKIILVTATPMKEGPGDLRLFLEVMNPRKEMPSEDFSKISFETLKPFIDNVSTFVRASTTGTLVRYEGERLGGTYEFINLDGDRGEDVRADIIVYPTIMSSEQTNFYISKFSSASFYRSARTASSGCEIDLDWIRKNVKNAFVGNVWPYGSLPPDGDEPSFTPARNVLAGLEELSKKSSKLGFAVKRAIGSWGHVFIYSDDVEASLNGVDRVAELLVASGFQKFTASMVMGGNPLSKMPRFCVLTSDVDEKTIAITKEIFNSKANVDGSLIKVFIASPKGKEGISVDGTREAHILTSSWLPSNDEQINARFVRATGHVLLRRYLEETLRRERRTLTEEQVHESVLRMSTLRVFRHVARMKKVPGDGSVLDIDDHIYHLCTQRSIRISRLMRMLKMTAIDCPLNLGRNVVRGRDHSGACDFMRCEFTCSNDCHVGGGSAAGSSVCPLAHGVSDELSPVSSAVPGIIASIEMHVIGTLLIEGFVSMGRIVEEMDDIPGRIINIAVSGMNGRIIRDRYGFPSQCEVKGSGISLVGGGSSMMAGFTASLGEDFNKGTVDLFIEEKNENIDELWRMFIGMTHSQRNEIVEEAAIAVRDAMISIAEEDPLSGQRDEEIRKLAVDSLTPSLKMIWNKMIDEDLFVRGDSIISTFMSTSTEFSQPSTEMKRKKMRILSRGSDEFVEISERRRQTPAVRALEGLGKERLEKFKGEGNDVVSIMATSTVIVPPGGIPIFFTRSYKLLR